MDYLFTEIINGQNYTVNITNNTLTIKLANDNTTLWLLDMENGTVYSLFINNNFTYKGATSQNNEYCCPNNFLTQIVGELTEKIHYNLPKENYINNSNTIPPYILKGLAFVGASATAGMAAVLLKSLPYVIELGLWPALGVGIVIAGCLFISFCLNWYYNGGDYRDALGSTLQGFALGLA